MAKKDIAALAGLAALGAILSQRGKNEVTGGASRDLAPSKDTDISDLVDRFPDMGPKSYAPPEDMPRSVATSPARSSRASAGPDERYMSGSAPSRATAKAPVRVDSGAGSTPDLTSRDQLRRVEREMYYGKPPTSIDDKPLEGVYPEQYLIAPGLKTASTLAKNLANRAPKIPEYIQPTLGYAERKLLGSPPKQLTGPSKAELVARDRAARAAARQEEMLQENARRYGLDPSAPGYEGTARAVRESLGDGAFTVKRKGGAIKSKRMASGGTTRSSASSRGDGIAKKGKTRGKMY